MYFHGKLNCVFLTAIMEVNWLLTAISTSMIAGTWYGLNTYYIYTFVLLKFVDTNIEFRI